MQALVASIRRLFPFAKRTKEFEIGRWKINYCNNIIKYKVEMANEDNCGGCSHYLNVKINDLNAFKQTNNRQNEQ